MAIRERKVASPDLDIFGDDSSDTEAERNADEDQQEDAGQRLVQREGNARA